MALNLYGKTNYELTVPLSLEYTKETAIGKTVNDQTMAIQYRYTRRATKTYRFKGMTAKAAQACLTAKRAQYTRPFSQWILYSYYWRHPWEITASPYAYMYIPDYMEQVADIQVSRNGDAPVYDVQITVDESTAIYSTRDYDIHTVDGAAFVENLFVLRTTDISNYPIATNYAANPEAYYHSNVRNYDYDENLSGDTLAS